MGILEDLVHHPDRVSYEDLVDILEDDSVNERLFGLADEVRRKYLGDEVFLRGIIEFSNYCRRSCLYCGIRAPNRRLSRYRMSPDEIVERAHLIASKGIKTVVLQSGEDPWYSPETISEIIRKIKEKADVAVTLSLGEWPESHYRLWKDSGADRYLMRHETASPELYRRLHPDGDLETRREKLLTLKRLGYEVGAGCMVGLPGQGPRELAMDLIFTRELDADMVGIGPFIPHPDTPLGNEKRGDLTTCLKMIALTRLLIPDSNIPATTAMGTIHPRGRELALKCGANVIMPNMTPSPYRARYQLYPGKICVFERDTICADCVVNLVKRSYYRVSEDKGFRIGRWRDELLRSEHPHPEQGDLLQKGERDTPRVRLPHKAQGGLSGSGG